MISGQRLEESLEYQQFVANVEEEEAWINEKMTLVASEDYGDTLAAIQVRDRGCCLLTHLPLPACSVAMLIPGEHSGLAGQGHLGDFQVLRNPCQRCLPFCRQNWGDSINLDSQGSLNPAVSPAVSLVSSPQVNRTSLASCDCLNKYHKLGGFKNYRSLFCLSLGSQRSGIKVSTGHCCSTLLLLPALVAWLVAAEPHLCPALPGLVVFLLCFPWHSLWVCPCPDSPLLIHVGHQSYWTRVTLTPAS